jgi:NADPH:quinone reductase-like Zn-dependent oxidoreductase
MRRSSWPDGFSDELAAQRLRPNFWHPQAVPISGLTALQGLRDAGTVQPGQKVLIIGAAGGVGTFAVQLAKAFGAEVTGVCSTTKVDLVRSIGADQVIDYTREDFADGARRYDLILDTAGNRSLRHLRRALTPGGRWSSWEAKGVDGGLEASTARSCGRPSCRGSRARRCARLTSKERSEDLVVLKELIEAGKVTPIIDRTYPLSEVPGAIRHLQEGHARGKTVITV